MEADPAASVAGAGPRPDRRATVKSSAVRTAWYRTVVCWKRQRASYLVLVVLLGLAGGVALGSLAGARRTATSFSTFLAASNPSDLTIAPAGEGPGQGPPNGAPRRRGARLPRGEARRELRGLGRVAGQGRKIRSAEPQQQRRSRRQLRWSPLQPGSFRRHQRPDGRSRAGRRGHGHAECGGGAGTACRPDRPRGDPSRLGLGARPTDRAQGGRHRLAESRGGAGPDRQIPHLHHCDAGPHAVGGGRHQHRVSGRAAARRRRRCRGR